MTRFDAFLLLRRFVRDQNALRLALATEAVMEGLAAHFGADESLWGQTGLLSSIDCELVAHNPKRRGRTAGDMLRAERLDAPLVAAVEQRLGPGPLDARLTRGLAAAEAAAMIALDAAADGAALAAMGGAELAACCDDPSVAPEASRTRVLALEQDGLSLPTLLELAREALLARADDLGL